MLKKTELREAVYEWIRKLGSGTVFGHNQAYRFLEEEYANECGERGDAASEPRYKNDARWAVQDALGKSVGKTKIVEPTSRGRFRRL
jgi:hypothetical protein